MKTTKQNDRELRNLVNQFAGHKGVAWGPAKKSRGMHVVLHQGEGATGNWASATLSNKESISFADKFVRGLQNAKHLPAISELIDEETRGLCAEITRLRCELMRAELTPASPRAIEPYRDNTALWLVKGAT